VSPQPATLAGTGALPVIVTGARAACGWASIEVSDARADTQASAARRFCNFM